MPGIPSALNLFLQSQTFNVTWSLNTASLTSGVTAPDGTTTAFKLVEDSSTAQHYIQQTITKPAATLNYTFSFYIKSVERSACVLQISDGGNGAFVVVDIPSVTTSGSGTFGAGYTVLSSGIATDAIATGSGGNGWYRCFLSISSSTATTTAPTLLMAIGGNDTYAGNGTNGMDIWGAQMIMDTISGPYTPTTTTSIFAPLFPPCMPEAVKRNPFIPDLLINPIAIPAPGILQSQIWL